MGRAYSYEASCACRVQTAERQSARMSKITNDSLTRSGAGCFVAVSYPYGSSGRQRVNTIRKKSLSWTQKLSDQLNLAHAARKNMKKKKLKQRHAIAHLIQYMFKIPEGFL